MISNKEKRLSQAYDVYTNHQIDGVGPPLPPPNHNPSTSNHISPYGMINNNLQPCNTNNVINGSGSKDMLLGKKLFNERNSHSLSLEFSQMYISNLKGHGMLNNHSLTQGKRPDRHDGPILPTLEEINSYKKEATETKKQMMQMEKSITYWSDCTEYWRTKWRKTRDERNSAKVEIKQLKSKLRRFEQQLLQSEAKRNQLNDEINVVNGELSKYVYRFDTDDGMMHRAKQPHSSIHFNSDRRVDYRKQRRKKEPQQSTSKRNDLSSTEEEDFQRFDRAPEVQLSKLSIQRFKDQPGTSSSGTNSKVILRNHERLFDKKIANRKRFSQVVMCDEDELFQFNQDIPSNSLSKNSDNNTLKYSENTCNDSINNDNNSYQQRFMEHVSEEEEEFFGEEEEENSSEHYRRRKQFLTCDSQNGFSLLKPNHSNLSTMATNSECPNVGSIRTDDVDEDSFRSDTNQAIQKAPAILLNTSVDADREGIGTGVDDDDEEDDEV